MFRKRVAFVGAFVLAAAGAAACSDGGGGTGSQAPRLTIRLTDAPGDLSEAWVEIERIVLVGDGGQVTLRDNSTGLVDLLTLRNSVAELVQDAVVPAGSYSELRFVIGDAYVRTKSGQVFATSGATLPAGVTSTGTLKCPSCSQSGLKVKLPGGSLALQEGARILVVDFDASASFGHEAGKSGQWVMHPVLHATDVQLAGEIAGTVSLATGVTLPATCGGSPVAITQFVPKAVAGADSISGAVEASGAYRIRYVTPGTYAMGQAPALTFANGDSLIFVSTPTPASVTVASGQTATANYSVTAATCQ